MEKGNKSIKKMLFYICVCKYVYMCVCGAEIKELTYIKTEVVL